MLQTDKTAQFLERFTKHAIIVLAAFILPLIVWMFLDIFTTLAGNAQ